MGGGGGRGQPTTDSELTNVSVMVNRGLWQRGKGGWGDVDLKNYQGHLVDFFKWHLWREFNKVG